MIGGLGFGLVGDAWGFYYEPSFDSQHTLKNYRSSYVT